MGLCDSQDPAAIADPENIPAELRAKYTEAGQAHVFKYADEGQLSEGQLDALLKQLEGIDVARVNQVYKDAIQFENDVKSGAGGDCVLEPLPQECCGNVAAMSPEERAKFMV